MGGSQRAYELWPTWIVDGEAVVVGKVLYESAVMGLREEELRVEIRQ